MPSKLELADDGGCFACGKLNPIGLKLDFDVEGDEYVTYFTPERPHQGWQGIVHGGIVSTVLDEVMARFVWFKGIRAVTGEMTVRYRRPCRVGSRIRFAGRVESEEGRIINARATASSEDGELLAEASAKFVKVT